MRGLVLGQTLPGEAHRSAQRAYARVGIRLLRFAPLCFVCSLSKVNPPCLRPSSAIRPARAGERRTHVSAHAPPLLSWQRAQSAHHH